MNQMMKKVLSTVLCTGILSSSTAFAANIEEVSEPVSYTTQEEISGTAVNQENALAAQSTLPGKMTDAEMQVGTISELQAEMEQQQQVMDDAHAMAESARSLGMPEDSVIIATAKLMWNDANTSYTALSKVLEEKVAEANRAVFTFDVFTKTNLSADDFNKLLEGTALAGHGQDFYDMEQIWSVNGLFALSVARTESSIGDSAMARNQNNYFGMIGLSFDSPREGILYFGELMNNSLYKGKAIESIAAIYCPPTASHWASQNRSFISGFWSRLNK